MRMSVHVYAPIGVTSTTGYKCRKLQCISYFCKINSQGYEQDYTLNQQQGTVVFELCGRGEYMGRHGEDQNEVLAVSLHTVL